MQTYYGIGYGVISLIFLGQAAGFIFGALCSEPLHRAAGRAITIVVGTSILAVATLLLALALPFGVVVVSFFLIGCAMSFVCIFYPIMTSIPTDSGQDIGTSQCVRCFSRELGNNIGICLW